MGNGTALKLLSDEVRDRIAVVTEEGLELEARLLAFARDAGEALRAFDAEVPHLDDRGVDRAGVRCGLVVLHAVVERMLDSLGRVVCPTWDEETAA